jgi:broad specificity phosphatase PhoE
MPTLTLVRHGQASFNSDDYDRLSELGARQAGCLAAHWLEQSVTFDRVFTGTLQRQLQTERLLAAAFTEAGQPWPEPVPLPGLNEFAAEKVVRKLAPELCLRDREVRRLYRQYKRRPDDDEALMSLVQRVCEYWVRGNYATPLSIRWKDFRAQVDKALATLSAHVEAGERVLGITSGGVISVAYSVVTGSDVDGAIARNWQIHNASVSQFRALGDGRMGVVCRAAVDHIEPELLTLR